jgi:hypothetical protein
VSDVPSGLNLRQHKKLKKIEIFSVPASQIG